jgi:hypothetical protein
VFVADFEFEDVDLVLEAVHRPKKHKRPTMVHGTLDINPKV